MIARNMAMRYGMDEEELGIVAYGEKQGSPFLGVDLGLTRNYSEEAAKKIDAFVRRVIGEQYERAKGIITTHKPKLELLVEKLMEVETMSLEEFLEIFEGKKEEVLSK